MVYWHTHPPLPVANFKEPELRNVLIFLARNLLWDSHLSYYSSECSRSRKQHWLKAPEDTGWKGLSDSFNVGCLLSTGRMSGRERSVCGRVLSGREWKGKVD